jgi:hypothetical protein
VDAAARALADLTEISSQIQAAVLLADGGALVAATGAEGERAQRLAEGARALLAAADEVRGAGAGLTQLEAATTSGSVFVVREGARTIAATTGTDPTVGLVFYDLKSALRAAQADEAAE